ncbi:hypothetical protein Tco_0274009 [Tanacetum coccineum]
MQSWSTSYQKMSIDSYEDLRTAFRENYLQQTKHIKDPVEIHHNKQRDGKSKRRSEQILRISFMDTVDTAWTMHASEKAKIDEMIKAGKLSQFIKELKQNNKPKAPKKGEASGKDKPLAILMIQPWERVAKPRITQSFSPETACLFTSGEEDGRRAQ